MAEPPYDPQQYTIAWVVALPEELAAATALLDEIHEEPTEFEAHETDPNSYEWGEIGKHNIVIASLMAGRTGIVSAATTAARLLASLPWIRFGLMIGISGGIPRPDRDIRLGDIVVGLPSKDSGGVIQYDRGASKKQDVWEPRSVLKPPPDVLLYAVNRLRAAHERMGSVTIGTYLDEMIYNYPAMARQHDKPGYVYQGHENDRLFEPTYDHEDASSDSCNMCDSKRQVQRERRSEGNEAPKIHYGVIGSGETLFKDAVRRDQTFISAYGDCLCVEMEAAGLVNTFPCIVVRGISNYADSHKNDQWKRYAAATAAAYAKELMGYVPKQKVGRNQTPGEAVAHFAADIPEVKEETDSIQAALPQQQSESPPSHKRFLLTSCQYDHPK